MSLRSLLNGAAAVSTKSWELHSRPEAASQRAFSIHPIADKILPCLMLERVNALFRSRHTTTE
jgi:hypothetical protein